VFSSNDVMAMGALAAAREHGRSVPASLSVMGCDDSPLAASPLLRLSSVDVRSEDVGREAAELLVALIDGAGSSAEAAPSPLAPLLVPRATTAPRP
jgi:DNA-binding LacI/PurR family transcriptional regulator